MYSMFYVAAHVDMAVVQPIRYKVDAWDSMMIDRDKRLTGHERGQSVRALRCCNSGSSDEICVATGSSSRS